MSLADIRKFQTAGTFPPVRRKLLGAAMLAAVVFGPAQPVFARVGNGGANSDHRIAVTGFES